MSKKRRRKGTVSDEQVSATGQATVFILAGQDAISNHVEVPVPWTSRKCTPFPNLTDGSLLRGSSKDLAVPRRSASEKANGAPKRGDCRTWKGPGSVLQRGHLQGREPAGQWGGGIQHRWAGRKRVESARARTWSPSGESRTNWDVTRERNIKIGNVKRFIRSQSNPANLTALAKIIFSLKIGMERLATHPSLGLTILRM